MDVKGKSKTKTSSVILAAIHKAESKDHYTIAVDDTATAESLSHHSSSSSSNVISLSLAGKAIQVKLGVGGVAGGSWRMTQPARPKICNTAGLRPLHSHPLP